MAKKGDKRTKRLRLEHENHLRKIESEKCFFQSMNRVLKALGLNGILDNLNSEEREYLNIFRVHSLKIIVEPQDHISHRIEKSVKNMVRRFIAEYEPIMIEGTPVPVQDLLTAGLTLKNLIHCNPEKKLNPRFIEVKEALVSYESVLLKMNSELLMKVSSIGDAASIHVSRIGQSMYLLTPTFYIRDKQYQKLRLAYALKLKRIRPESMKIEIDGTLRNAYRLGWPISFEENVHWISYRASDIDPTVSMANLPLPLYIQSHALLRLRERLSGAYYDSLHIGLICSVLQKNIVPTSRKNTVLIAFELLGIKVGYLVAEPIDGIILVKTFLFITNSGTPEGETLNRVLGIGKLEKAFLKIDSLAVFVASDMLQDQRVRDIFENVGLGYLCEIEKKMQFKTRDKGYAQDFLRYIKPVIKTDTIGTSSSPKQEQSPEETQVNVNEFCEVRRAK